MRRDPGRYYGYVRTAPGEVVEAARAQRDAIRAAYPEVREVFHDDAVAGAAPLEGRAALLALLRGLDRGDTLVAVSRERVTRDLFLAAWIEKQAALIGFSVVFLDDRPLSGAPTEKLLHQVAQAFADFERSIARVRRHTAMSERRERGERVGPVPYGFRLLADGKTLVMDDQQQAVITKIMRMHRRLPGLRRIARKLNEEGIPSPRGKAWNPVTVSKIIRREQENAYAGAKSRKTDGEWS